MTLTPEQRAKIAEIWNRTPEKGANLKDVTREIFGEGFDGRSEEGKAIRDAMAEMKLEVRTTTKYEPEKEIELTEEMKLFIANNLQTMNNREMARIIFKDDTLTGGEMAVRAVTKYRNSLPKAVQAQAYDPRRDADMPESNYEPPKTLATVLKRVNCFLNDIIDKDKMTANQKKGLEQLINYLHVKRFVRQMNTFDSIDDRDTCEDAFIRYTYDKPDLTQEEVDQFIELANQVVQGFKILRRSEQMQNRLETITGNDAENMKVSMGLVEAIGKAGTEYDQCIKRQQKLLDDLKEKRSTRLSKAIKENASILNLVKDWRDEEQRVKMLKYVQIEQEKVSNEVEKLTNMAEIKARIMGLNKDSILNG